MKSKKLNIKFQNLKSENGITLIALIITIVVMLILVAVTLSIALGENGIVNNAKEAKEKTEQEMIYEKLLSSAELTKDGVIDVTKTIENIQELYPEAVIEDSGDGKKVTIEGKDYLVTQEEISEFKTIWERRGLSSKVKLDRFYQGELNLGGQIINFSIKYNSDGSLYVSTGSLTSEQVDEKIENGEIYITGNDLSAYHSNGKAITGVLDGDGGIMYFGDYDISNPSHVERTEENYAGRVSLVEE